MKAVAKKSVFGLVAGNEYEVSEWSFDGMKTEAPPHCYFVKGYGTWHTSYFDDPISDDTPTLPCIAVAETVSCNDPPRVKLSETTHEKADREHREAIREQMRFFGTSKQDNCCRKCGSPTPCRYHS